MMHRDDFVVSIRPVGGKAFREFKLSDIPDTTYIRTRRICVPFYQEYEFVFKNMKDVRRSVCIRIDGNEIGTWVVEKGTRQFPTEVALERFLDSDKRFKVLPINDGGVDDPTNPQNGVITIVVTDEKEIQYLKCFRSSGGIMRGMQCSTASYSANAATGEGSRSSQEFLSTHWQGDGSTPLYFVFRIHGVDRPGQSRNAVLFCHECGSELVDGSKFCHHCGTKVMVAVVS